MLFSRRGAESRVLKNYKYVNSSFSILLKQELQIVPSSIAYPRVACEMAFRDRRIASAPASPRSVAERVSGVLTHMVSVLVEQRRADDEAARGLTLLPGVHREPVSSF